MMVIEKNPNPKTSLRYKIIYTTVIVFFILIWILLLYYLLILNTHLILIFFIELFVFLVLYGSLVQLNKKLLVKIKIQKKEDYLSKKEKFLEDYKKLRPRRRIDYIDLNKKYQKVIIRKCPNCGTILPSFVKRCPNCGERVMG
ncbi:MAG: zinc-ribbon domain-containing protein [Promethearchaeota archaeon]